MNIKQILSLDSPTIVFILACIIILVGIVSLILLILGKQKNALISVSLIGIIYGCFLVVVDRILVQYINYNRLNRMEILVLVLLGILYIFQNWKKIKKLFL